MRVAVFLDHDITIRHFLLSGAFDELLARHNVAYVFPSGIGQKRVSVDAESLKYRAHITHVAIDPDRVRRWRWLFIANKLRGQRGGQHAALRNHHKTTLGPKGYLILKFLSLPIVFQVYRWFVIRDATVHPNEPLEAFIDGFEPDVIVHPTVLAGYFIDDLIQTCRRRDIPMVGIMNSWDNPSTKHGSFGNPDKLLVWGEQTHAHAIEYMGMSASDVVRFGAAQFDVYREPSRISREEFCRLHDIEPEKRILLYAGSSKDTDEFAHLMAIENWIESGLIANTAVVYRPHPWGGGGRRGERIVRHQWKHLRIESSMRSYLENVEKNPSKITIPDYRVTRDVLSSVDAVLSPLSTILLEAALLGKPPLCFLPEEEVDAQHLQLNLPLTHFEDMFAAPEFTVARGIDELEAELPEVMRRSTDDAFKSRLIGACRFFVEPFDRPFKDRIVTFLEGHV